jgi:hypothetical protein
MKVLYLWPYLMFWEYGQIAPMSWMGHMHVAVHRGPPGQEFEASSGAQCTAAAMAMEVYCELWKPLDCKSPARTVQSNPFGTFVGPRLHSL